MTHCLSQSLSSTAKIYSTLNRRGCSFWSKGNISTEYISEYPSILVFLTTPQSPHRSFEPKHLAAEFVHSDELLATETGHNRRLYSLGTRRQPGDAIKAT